LLLLLCGWGNNGCGNNAGGNFTSYELGRVATTNDVASGFSTSAVMSNQREMQLALTTGFADVQQTLCQGFSDVNATVNAVGNTINQGLCTLGYNFQSGLNDIDRHLSDCCCNIGRAIDGVNYNMAKNTCDIIQANNNNTQRLLDYWNCRETQDLRDKLQTANFQISQMNQNAFITANQNAQTAELIRRLGRDCPVPAYVVPNPNCCTTNSCCMG
jgi:hypothetical protein